jgi:hypothetical protein
MLGSTCRACKRRTTPAASHLASTALLGAACWRVSSPVSPDSKADW